MVEILIVLATVGLLAAVAMPTFIKARTAPAPIPALPISRKSTRPNSNGHGNKQPPRRWPASTDLIGANLYIRNPPTCPVDTASTFASSYTIGNVSAESVLPKGFEHQTSSSTEPAILDVDQ